MSKNKASLSRLITLISCVLLFASQATATIHYVAKDGTMVPPYTTWETASWFIELAADISAIGDTVMIESGDYQVYSPIYLLNPGITLMGVGMDSTRLLGKVGLDYMLVPADDDVIRDLTFIGDPITEYGSELFGPNSGILIPGNYDRISFTVEHCRFMKFKFDAIRTLDDVDNCWIRNCDFYDNRWYSLSLGHLGNYYIENCSFREHWYYGVNSFIDFTTSLGKRIVRGNHFEGEGGIECDFLTSGYLEVENNTFRRYVGFRQAVTASVFQAIIRNNSIYMTDPPHHDRYAIQAFSCRDSLIIENNAIYSVGAKLLVDPSGSALCRITNNCVLNELPHTPEQIIVLERPSTGILDVRENLFLDPMFVDPDSGDFRLQQGSPCIDQGTNGQFDLDSSRCDIGAAGGPWGAVHEYENLPPKLPRLFTGSAAGNELSLRWLANTESDLMMYEIYSSLSPSIPIDGEHLLAYVFLTDSNSFNGSDADSEFVVYATQLPEPRATTFYAIRAIDDWGAASELTEPYQLTATGVSDEQSPVPSDFILFQNSPNPFNAETEICFELPKSATQVHTSIVIYNLLGHRVRTLLNRDLLPGRHSVHWDGLDDLGSEIASGVYFYRLQISGKDVGRPLKMLLIK